MSNQWQWKIDKPQGCRPLLTRVCDLTSCRPCAPSEESGWNIGGRCSQIRRKKKGSINSCAPTSFSSPAERLSNQSQRVSAAKMTSSPHFFFFFYAPPYFYFRLCLINLGTLLGSWQPACKVRFVHCSLSLMKWRVRDARKLDCLGGRLLWVSWRQGSRQPSLSRLHSSNPTPRLIAPLIFFFNVFFFFWAAELNNNDL